MFRRNTENSIDPKSEPILLLPEPDEMSRKMREKLEEYVLSLHGISESIKDDYISQVRTFTCFLMNRSIKRYEDVTTKDIDLFLSNYQKDTIYHINRK